MFPRLIDDCGGQQLRRIELAHGEALEPRVLTAREAVHLRAPGVPQLHVDAIRTALAEEEDSHRLPSVPVERRKSKTSDTPVAGERKERDRRFVSDETAA